MILYICGGNTHNNSKGRVKMNEKLTCIGCKKEPEEIDEYKYYANEDNLTPTEWVRRNEVVGKWGKGHNTFYCTSCYIAAGMPLRS